MCYGRVVIGCDFKAVPRGDGEVTSSYQMENLAPLPQGIWEELICSLSAAAKTPVESEIGKGSAGIRLDVTRTDMPAPVLLFSNPAC